MKEWCPHINIWQVSIYYKGDCDPDTPKNEREWFMQREFFLFYFMAKAFIKKNEKELRSRGAEWSIGGKDLWLWFW